LDLAPDAIDLLRRAFQSKGGINAAYSEGMSSVRGGMKYILDVMTEQLKQKEKEKHIRAIFRGSIDPLDFGQKVALIEAFLNRVGPNLPGAIQSRTAEQYATDYEEIIRAYSESLEKVIATLKIL
jgi:hypothetical protein